MDRIPLVLIPGLATDGRVFAPQREAFPDLIVPEWLEPRRRETLCAYAERWADQIRAPGPLVVGGLSLGGMLALELARHLPARRVVLIGSCRHPRAVNRWLHAAERLARPWPTGLMERVKKFTPAVVGRGGTIPRERRGLLAEMLQSSPADFIRWGGRALLEWPGCADCRVPVWHIHGGRDWVIPLRNVSPTRVIPEGSHVLNLSHPAEVSSFLDEATREA